VQYLRARYYDPKTAQFITRDPLEAETGQPYLYANGNPTLYTDPSGMSAFSTIADVGGAAINGATLGLVKPGWVDPCSWAGFAGEAAGGAVNPLRVFKIAGAAAAAGVSLVRGARATRGTSTVARLAQDIAVNPVPPNVLSLNRSIGRASHNRALQREMQTLRSTATNLRVNQQQVNLARQRVGINRPDLQYTLNGKRHYVEFEGLDNPRGAAHEARIRANDPNAEFHLRIVP
jgi:uncharacterized protein RhaS with RHS repeats